MAEAAEPTARSDFCSTDVGIWPGYKAAIMQQESAKIKIKSDQTDRPPLNIALVHGTDTDKS